MLSTDRRLELKEKTSMAQTVWQPVVYAKGLRFKIGEGRYVKLFSRLFVEKMVIATYCRC